MSNNHELIKFANMFLSINDSDAWNSKPEQVIDLSEWRNLLGCEIKQMVRELNQSGKTLFLIAELLDGGGQIKICLNGAFLGENRRCATRDERPLNLQLIHCINGSRDFQISTIGEDCSKHEWHVHINITKGTGFRMDASDYGAYADKLPSSKFAAVA